jgi:hypothetical protein
MVFFALIALAAAGLHAPGPPAEPLSLSVTPSVCLSPCEIRARVLIEPHADNRRLVLTADSEWFRRSSTIPLEGDAAARSHIRTFRRLPAGTYVVSVRLERSGADAIVEELQILVKS